MLPGLAHEALTHGLLIRGSARAVAGQVRRVAGAVVPWGLGDDARADAVEGVWRAVMPVIIPLGLADLTHRGGRGRAAHAGAQILAGIGVGVAVVRTQRFRAVHVHAAADVVLVHHAQAAGADVAAEAVLGHAVGIVQAEDPNRVGGGAVRPYLAAGLHDRLAVGRGEDPGGDMVVVHAVAVDHGRGAAAVPHGRGALDDLCGVIAGVPGAFDRLIAVERSASRCLAVGGYAVTDGPRGQPTGTCAAGIGRIRRGTAVAIAGVGLGLGAGSVAAVPAARVAVVPEIFDALPDPAVVAVRIPLLARVEGGAEVVRLVAVLAVRLVLFSAIAVMTAAVVALVIDAGPRTVAGEAQVPVVSAAVLVHQSEWIPGQAVVLIHSAGESC